MRTKERQHENIRVQQATSSADSTHCTQCGAFISDPGAAYCEECGNPLHSHACPACNHTVEPGMDLCEHCHEFIASNQCTFCGEYMGEDDAFCAECGASRKGIICPQCNLLSHTAFCANCNTPLTEIAIRERQKAQQEPQYQQVVAYSKEINTLEKELAEIIIPEIEEEPEPAPVEVQRPKTEKELQREKRNAELEALYQSLVSGKNKPVVRQEPPAPAPAPDRKAIEEKKKLREEKQKAKEELERKIAEKRKELQKVLSEMKPNEPLSSQDMRNYYAARKPEVSNGVWLCYFNNCYHPNPSHCGKPFMGGEWVVVNEEIKWETHHGNM